MKKLTTTEKLMIIDRFDEAKRLVKNKALEVKDFIHDHHTATGIIMGLAIVAIVEMKVIDAADEVIGDLGGWD